MDQNRWKTVNEIFHAALEVPTSERPEFVSKASGSDRSLAQEVNQLLQADLDAGSYIESPIADSSLLRSALNGLAPSLKPGDVLCARFRILRAAGEGGMGNVFEAMDDELGVNVALKIIRPEIASNPEALARFRQEVRLARRITHPNVCRTFDIERETRIVDAENGISVEFVFLTMEFLQGETLAERIARDGPLPLDLAGDLARQVADALQAAHALGVIHRDMKPANIMLVPEPSCVRGLRAVITDFGLARAESIDSLRSLSGISARGNPIGTLAYMAPEQLSGAALSAATDVYAFGLVLYEMVTGKRAFPSQTLLSGITQRLAGPPPDPSVHAPDLPETWRRAIAGCLEVKPAERVQAVADAIAILDGRSVDFPARRFSFRTIRIWLTWPRAFAALFILCAAVSLFWAGLRFSRLGANAKVAPGALVYLAPVRNETGEKDLDNLTELIRAGLAQSAQINLLDQGRVGDTLQRMTRQPDTVIDEPIAREIAMRNGAVRVVFARVTGSQGNYRLDVDIQQPDNTPSRFRDHWKKSFLWQSVPSGTRASIPQDLLVAVRNASDWIRKDAGESANDIARLDVPPEDVTTANWQDVEDYSQAELLAADNRPEAAATALRHALDRDPQFALAWGRMGDLLLSLGRDMDGFEAYDKALDLGLQSRLTRREEDRIRGMRAVDAGDYQLAVDAFHDYGLNYAADPAAWTYPLGPLHMLHRDSEAISDLQRALSLEPNSEFAQFGMANELILTGRYEDARTWDARLRTSYPELADRVDRVLTMLDGHLDHANEFARRATASSDSERRSYGYEEQASIAGDRGDWAGAIEILNHGLKFDDSLNNRSRRSWKLLDRSYDRLQIGDFEGCLSDVDSALGSSSSPWLVPVADTVLGTAFVTAPAKYGLEIKRELNEVQQHLAAAKETGAIFEFGKLRTEGELLLVDGHAEAAVTVFRKAAVQDAPAGDREYMGRALVALASHKPNPSEANKLLTEAFQSYSVTVLNPASIWCQPSSYPPGFYGNQLEAYLKLADRLHLSNSDVLRARGRQRGLRPQAADLSNRTQTESQ